MIVDYNRRIYQWGWFFKAEKRTNDLLIKVNFKNGKFKMFFAGKVRHCKIHDKLLNSLWTLQKSRKNFKKIQKRRQNAIFFKSHLA